MRRRSRSRGRGDITLDSSDVIFVEAFFGGSHAQLIRTLQGLFEGSDKTCSVYSLPPKKWHWRLTVAAAYFAAEAIPPCTSSGVFFASSMVNLADIVALRPNDIGRRHKVLYFHENQLAYPYKDAQQNAQQFSNYGWAQAMSCLAADAVYFNSSFNLESFLTCLNRQCKMIPAASRPRGIIETIRRKSQVLYYPIPNISPRVLGETDKDDLLHIVWAHRWEHDKRPDAFLDVLTKLSSNAVKFVVSVVGEKSSEAPPCFESAKPLLMRSNDVTVRDWGYLSRSEYLALLKIADVAVSTASQEFFGVSMMEAVASGCYPLCPRNVVYPELYPSECLFNTQNQLYKRLKDFCLRPRRFRGKRRTILAQINAGQYQWDYLKHRYAEALGVQSLLGEERNNSSSSSCSWGNEHSFFVVAAHILGVIVLFGTLLHVYPVEIM